MASEPPSHRGVVSDEYEIDEDACFLGLRESGSAAFGSAVASTVRCVLRDANGRPSPVQVNIERTRSVQSRRPTYSMAAGG